MTPNQTRQRCQGCQGYITCVSYTRKINIRKGNNRTLDTLDTLDTSTTKAEKKLDKGSLQTSPVVEDSSTVHERSLLAERTSSIIKELISDVVTQGYVIPEWPLLFLKRHQMSHDEAVNILEGLRLANKLVQRDDGSWEVPS